MTHESNNSDGQVKLSSLSDFAEHTIKVLKEARRNVIILTHSLDPILYDQAAVREALSEFARYSPNSQARILVRNTKDMVERGHSLLKLHQKIPTHIRIRKIGIEPRNVKMAYLGADTSTLIYKNDDSQHLGYANYQAQLQLKSLREEFDHLWEFASDDPELRQLNL